MVSTVFSMLMKGRSLYRYCSQKLAAVKHRGAQTARRPSSDLVGIMTRRRGKERSVSSSGNSSNWDTSIYSDEIEVVSGVRCRYQLPVILLFFSLSTLLEMCTARVLIGTQRALQRRMHQGFKV